MARARIYIRRSNEEQSAFSPEAQERQCRQWCADNGHAVVEPLYLDDDISGTREDRPQLQRLLTDAKADPGSLIVVHKLDRLARDTEMMLRIVYKVLEPRRVQVESVSERIDFYTPVGKALLTVSGAFSAQYIDNLRAEVRKGLREKAEQGGWIGLPPYGYMSLHQFDHKGERVRGTHRLAPSSDAPAVRLIFSEYSTGNHSDSTLRDLLHEQGYTFLHPKTGLRVSFQRDSVGGILRNPAYIGVVRCGGQLYAGTHEPLIDRDLWDRCQAIRERRTRQRGGRVPVRGTGGLLSELAFCGLCDARLRWWASGEGASRQGYYRCARHVAYGRDACAAPMIQARRIEGLLLDVVRELRVPDRLRDQVLFELRRRQQAPIGSPSVDRERVQRQLDRLRAVFLSGDESVSHALYQAESARLKALLTEEAPRSAARLDVEKALGLLNDLPALLDGAALAHRRALLQQLFARVWLEKEQVTAVEPSPLFMPLLAAVDNLYTTSTGLEPARRRRVPLWQGFAVPV